MKVAVVGHLEWGTFAKVDKVPKQGEIIPTSEWWEEATGGGVISAMQLASLAGNCMFFTTIGADPVGQTALAQLQASGIEVYASIVENQPTKQIFTYIDAQKERTITTLGKLQPQGTDSKLPWEKLREADAVYFASGDQAALLAARQAKVLVSTARILSTLQQANVQLQALVCSKTDAGEQYSAGDLSKKPNLIVTTDSIRGGETDSGITYAAEVVPFEQIVDTCGCGDSFAAGLTFALGQRMNTTDALKLAAHAGADAARRQGTFGARSA